MRTGLFLLVVAYLVAAGLAVLFAGLGWGAASMVALAAAAVLVARLVWLTTGAERIGGGRS